MIREENDNKTDIFKFRFDKLVEKIEKEKN